MQSIRPATVIFFLVALCLLPFVQEANAVFKVNDPTPLAPPSHPVATIQTHSTVSSVPFVVETGTITTERINSVGSDLPLKIALRQILPTGWQINDDVQNPLLFKRVSWDISQKTLPQALTKIGQQENVRFFVNGEKKQLTILPLKVSSRVVKALSSASPAVTVQSTPPKRPVASVPEFRYVVWKLESGSMRKQLEKWCLKNNWTMAWTASLDDYIIPVSATFEGEFKEIVYEAFQVLRRTAGCGVKPRFYKGNNVVEVRDI